ncbi:GIY-YIG nuclease family protein [Candidatus Curtissbacteria bacterium]|nr:GIY-YIG nuclease family protein [Candidatus Curtissbacteria bacterium]
MFYYVYILFSLKDKNLYVGRTSDIFKRLERHNNGRVIATKSRRPLKLIHLEVFKDAGKAFLREKELKYPSAGKFKKELREKLGIDRV